MIARAHRAWFILVTTGVLAMGLLATGCAATRILARNSAPQARAGGSPAPTVVPGTSAVPGLGGGTIPDPGPTGIHPAATDVAVIRGWADALRRGDVSAAARFFALPSVMINGTAASGAALVIGIDTPAEAQAANASLPCGAEFISADQRGRYVNALFRLTGRPGPGGSSCGGGVGETARTNFVIAHGRIVEWIRAPDDPGDNGGSAPPPSGSPETLPPSPPAV